MLIIMEKICKKHGLTEYNNSNKCKKCNVINVQRRRIKIKKLAIEYKGGKCEKCGYDKCDAALDFHHIDSNQKEFGIGNKGYTRSWERIKIELDKCILVCANCHREIHSS